MRIIGGVRRADHEFGNSWNDAQCSVIVVGGQAFRLAPCNRPRTSDSVFAAELSASVGPRAGK